MQNCEFVTLISILACSIAKDKTADELAVLSTFFTQLRRYTSYTYRIRWYIKWTVSFDIVFLKLKVQFLYFEIQKLHF